MGRSAAPNGTVAGPEGACPITKTALDVWRVPTTPEREGKPDNPKRENVYSTIMKGGDDMAEPITIKDIANMCGVSIATVSRVVNNSPKGVGEKTFERIRKGDRRGSAIVRTALPRA